MQLYSFVKTLNKSNAGPKVLVSMSRRSTYAAKKERRSIICYYCRQNGHFVRDCLKWLAEGKPQKTDRQSCGSQYIYMAITPCVNLGEILPNNTSYFHNGTTQTM